ncbi:hypothetical protein OK016_11390 [Vibrio chagasii]|nr:hypothetical protein [Vibrio chagasii]
MGDKIAEYILVISGNHQASTYIVDRQVIQSADLARTNTGTDTGQRVMSTNQQAKTMIRQHDAHVAAAEGEKPDSLYRPSPSPRSERHFEAFDGLREKAVKFCQAWQNRTMDHKSYQPKPKTLMLLSDGAYPRCSIKKNQKSLV